jgi:hypothetical protein
MDIIIGMEIFNSNLWMGITPILFSETPNFASFLYEPDSEMSSANSSTYVFSSLTEAGIPTLLSRQRL